MKLNDQIINNLKINARRAFDNDEIPIACVIIDSMGNVVSEGINDRQSTGNVLGHAEINAIIAAEKVLKDWRLDGYSMIVNLEPCEMCSSIIRESRIDKVYYFLPKKGNENDYDFNINKIEIEDNDNSREYFLKLLTSFFDKKR